MFVYGITTVGATVHVHYCMDKIIGWDLSQTESRTCGKCGMKESATKKGCCKDEVKQLKVDNDHQKSTVTFLPNIFSVPALKLYPSLSEFNNVALNIDAKTNYYSPPLLPFIQKRTILYCTYRI